MYILLFILISIGLLIAFALANKKEPKNKSTSKDNGKQNTYQKLYKKKGVKSFGVKGMYYLIDSNYAGDFTGKVICETNKHDKYAVSVYNAEGEKIGYVPKGNHILYNSIKEWHSGSSIAWGSLRYDEYHEKWANAYVEIPVGYSNEALKKLEEAFEALNKRKEILKQNNISSNEYLEIINNYYKINKAFNAIQKELIFKNRLSKYILPRLSKQLEKEKNWEELVNLENHKEIIEELSEVYINSIEKRILKAKEILKKNN